VNEIIKTQFELDAKQMEQSVKDIDKLVNNFKTNFKETEQVVAKCKQELQNVNKEVTQLANQNVNIAKLKNTLGEIQTKVSRLENDFKNATVQANALQNVLKGIGQVNTSDLTRMQSMLQSMQNIRLFDPNAFNTAINQARVLVSTLNGINTPHLTGLANSGSGSNADVVSAIQGLRHWIDQQNGGAASQEAQDTTRLLVEMNGHLQQIQQSLTNPIQNANNNELQLNQTMSSTNGLLSPLISAIRSLTTAVGINSNFIRNASNQTNTSAPAHSGLVDQHGNPISSGTHTNAPAGNASGLLQNMINNHAPNNLTADTNATNASFRALMDNISGRWDFGPLRLIGGIKELGKEVWTAVGAFAKAHPVITGVVVAIGAYAMGMKVLVGIMKEGVKVSIEYETAIAKFAARTGASQKEIKAFGDDLKKGFRQQGFTTDLAAYGEALQMVKQNLKDVNGTPLTSEQAIKTTKDVLAFSMATGLENKEIIRAQQSAMKGFGIDASDALSLIERGYQITGDLQGDWLDTVREYAPQFKRSGLSAEFFFATVEAGTKAGVFNTDKMGDSIKEFQNKFTNADQSMKDGLGKLNLSFKDLKGEMDKGGTHAEQAFIKIVKGIKDVKSNSERQSIVSSIFGGPGEDATAEFINQLAVADYDLNNFKNTASETTQTLENMTQVKIDKMKNAFTDLYDSIGKDALPIIKTVLDQVEAQLPAIQKVVEEELSPAFGDLMAAIASAFGVEDFQNFGSWTETAVSGLADVVAGFAWVTMAVGKVFAVIRILWNAVTILLKEFWLGLKTLGTLIAQLVIALIETIKQIYYGWADILDSLWTLWLKFIGYIVEGIDRLGNNFNWLGEWITIVWDNAWEIAGKSFSNFVTWIMNGVKGLGNYVADKVLNPLIDAYNSTLGQVPGAPRLDRFGAGGAFTLSGYKSTDQNWKNIDNAGKNKYSDTSAMDKMYSSAQDSISNDYMKRLASRTTDSKNSFNNFLSGSATLWQNWYNENKGLAESIAKDGQDIIDATKQLFDTSSYEKLRQQYRDAIEKGRIQRAKEEEDKKKNSGKDTTGGKIGGKDPTEKELADAKKAEEEALKAKQEYNKSIIAMEKELQKQEIEFLLNTNQKKWDMMGETQKRYQQEFDLYQQIKERYKLTRDEILSYDEKQYQALRKIQEVALKDFKKTQDDELKAVLDKNNAKIKANQALIDKINDQQKQTEITNANDDAQKEIDRLTKKWNMYKHYESGEAKKIALDTKKELDDAILAQTRELDKQKLDKQKDALEKENKTLEQNNNDTKDKYDRLYQSLTDAISGKENALKDIREKITNETNENIKKGLKDLESAYKTSYDNIKKYTMPSNTELQNMNIVDAKRSWSEGNMTGDTNMMNNAAELARQARLAGGTIPNQYDMTGQLWGVSGSPDYQEFKANGLKWTSLESSKPYLSEAELEKAKAEQNALHERNNYLRRKYGVTDENASIPMYEQGGPVLAVLHDGEAVLAKDKYTKLMNFINGLNPNNITNKMISSMASGIVNNVNIGNVNINNGMDLAAFSDTIYNATNRDNRFAGRR